MGNSAKPVDLLSGSEFRRQVRATARRRALALVDQLITQVAPDLSSGQPGAGLTREQSMKIVEDLQADVSAGQLRSCRKYLRAKLRQLAAQTKGEVVEPPRETYVRRDESPFAGEALSLIRGLNALLAQFAADIQDELPGSDSTARGSVDCGPETPAEAKARCRLALGRILFSAVVNGGLVHERLLRQLLPALCVDLQGRGDYAWVSFSLDGPDETESAGEEDDDDDDDKQSPDVLDLHVRRWFLDPVTLGLVTRWRASRALDGCRRDLEVTTAHQALTSYLSYLRKRGLPPGGAKVGRSWGPRLLIKAARARLSLYLPQVLVRFLSSLSAGQSMSERTWWRYRFNHWVPGESRQDPGPDLTTELAAETQPLKHEFRGNVLAFYRLQEELLEILRQCLSQPKELKNSVKAACAVRAIEGVVKQRRNDLSPLLFSYYQWILWKLSRPSKRQGRIRVVSAKRYTSRLGRALIALGTELSPAEMNPSDWEEFYDDVLESLESPVDRRKARGNLRDLHDFLMITINAPQVAIDGDASAGSRGRATLITDEDYGLALEALEQSSGQAHRSRVLRLIVILMYRVGLRPHEIVELEYGHFHGCGLSALRARSARPVLYLKARSRGDLKTRSAVRQIPLYWFLQDSEMEEFQAYLYDKISNYREDKLETAVLFTTQLGSNDAIPKKEIFGLVTDLFRQVTGDQNVVAYSLRHSCLSNLFLEISRPRSQNIPVPREATYALSTLAGHLDPDVSLGTYIHLQDYAAHLQLRAFLADQPIAFWASLEGKRASSLHQRRSRSGAGNDDADNDSGCPQWLDTSRRLIRKLDLGRPTARPRQKVELPEQAFEPLSLLDLDIETLHALFFSHLRNHSEEARARLFDLPSWQIKSLTTTSVRLGGYESAPIAGESNSRTLRKLPKGRKLPARFRRAQPGMMAPAPPNYRREEMAEAQRIHKLLIKRAQELRLDKSRVLETILKPVRDLLFAHSRSESVIRITSAAQLISTITTLRSLNIPPGRIEIEIEALPSSDMPDAGRWMRKLHQLSKSRKLKMGATNARVTRRSRKYPEFGILKLRVLELAKPNVGESIRNARDRSGERAGSGWRVGCYYALVVLTSLLYPDAKP